MQVVAPAEPAIEGNMYKVMCNVTGAAKHVYWMKNGELVFGDNRTSLDMENRTLTFYALERNDKGYYQCMASNPVWNMTSPSYHLLVNCEYRDNSHIIIYKDDMSHSIKLSFLLLQLDLMSQSFMARLSRKKEK